MRGRASLGWMAMRLSPPKRKRQKFGARESETGSPVLYPQALTAVEFRAESPAFIGATISIEVLP
jgi:hypothetical protein